MATYKVIQDIEAEDKLLGPLTLRQFIYAAITIVIGFIIFKTMASGIWYIALPLAPIMFFFGLLAAPFGHDQSSEVWMLGKVRFWIKPKMRIWDQDGMSDLVTITAPKPQPNLTDGLSQTEVHSRLEALATTIDSRGWAIKELGYDPFVVQPTDRLVKESETAQDTSPIDLSTVTDVMDENKNPTAQNFDKLMAASEASHRQQISSNMQRAAAGTTDAKTKSKSKGKKTGKQQPDFWFMKEDKTPTDPGISIFDNPAIVAPGSTSTTDSVSVSSAEQAIIERARQEQIHPLPIMYHLNNMEPINSQPVDGEPSISMSNVKLPPIITKKLPDTTSYSTPQAPSPVPPQAATMDAAKTARLAADNNLYVDTVSREANRGSVHVDTKDDEVVIDLHYSGA